MRIARVVVAGALALLCVAAVAQESEQPADVPAQDDTTDLLATVDGEPIDADELWWYMENTRGGQVLDEMIVRRLIMQEAEERGVKAGTPEVDEALDRIRQEHGVETGFERWLHENGQTEKGLRLELQQELLLDKLIRRHMGLTEEGIQRYYDSHPHEFTEAPRVHLLDIVTLTVDDAFIARERLAGGQDFAEVAREMSHDPTSEDGGDRGWITPDDVLCENVAEAIFALEEGEISNPVNCEDHAHVFFAREVEAGRQIPLDEARDAVIERIREVRGISEELYLALLKRRAGIDVRWEAAAYLNDLYAEERAVKVVVDGTRIDLAANPRLLPNSNLIVPIVGVLEAMGADVEWNSDAGVLEVERDGMRLRLVAGAAMMAVGGEEISLRETPRLIDGVLMASPRGPIEAIGGSLVWNRTENTLYVSSRADEE
ncbi:MAG: peptidyl-prolyl cis-trans isomerase [Armatimonadota bacterium]